MTDTRDNFHMNLAPPLSQLGRRSRRCPGSVRARQGFTLIELAITVALVAILASLAYPSFMEAIYKGRRSEAFSAITTLQLAQERWRANNASYTSDFSHLNLQHLQSGGRNYLLSIPEATANAYRLRATATGRQGNDTRCAIMEVRIEGGSIQYGSSCSTCTPGATLSDTNRCWSRQ